MSQNDIATPNLEGLVKGVEFLLTFGKAPREALDSYRGLDQVSMDLALLLTGAVVLSTFMLWVLGRMGWKSDPKVTRKIFGQHVARFVGGKFGVTAPLAAMVLIVLATLLVHGFARTWTVVDDQIHLLNSNLGGTVLDSINASLAFSSFFIPVGTLCAVIVGTISRARREWERVATEVAGVFLGLLFMIYYPLALSGVHPETSYGQVITVLAGWFVGLLLLASVAVALLKIVR